MLTGVIIIAIFLAVALMMFLKKLPALLALPIMAVAIALAARVPAGDILKGIISDGSIRLALPMATVFFGAMLGQLIKESGIAKVIIRKVAELGGDNPFWVSFTLSIVTALLFTVLGGLGAVIMVATIVLPILLSIGVPSVAAGSIFLIGISLGGILNLTNWQLYMSVLSLKQTDILSFALPLLGVMTVVLVVFLMIELRRNRLSRLWAARLPEKEEDASYLSLLTPLIPLALVLGFSLYNLLAKPARSFEFPIIAAMSIGLLYGVVTTWRGASRSVNLLTKSVIEGISSSAPAIALIMGIGMLLNSVMHPLVARSISPLIIAILPGTMAGYVIFFSVLAPLTLYRGPLNIWGLGSGMIGIMMGAHTIPAAAIMAAMLSVGQIQGVCDPTNTHNVWIGNFLNVDVQDILKKTIVYIWVLAVIGLLIAGVKYF